MGPWSHSHEQRPPGQCLYGHLGEEIRMDTGKGFFRASAASAAFMAAFVATSAWADYPDRPIKIIVPFAAGSGTDVVARATGMALSKRMGVPVVVENTVGA